MNITIYHDPHCGTSRNVLALIRNSDEEPKIIEYLGRLRRRRFFFLNRSAGPFVKEDGEAIIDARDHDIRGLHYD